MKKIAIFSAHNFEKPYLESAIQNTPLKLSYFDTRLNSDSVTLAKGFSIISCFVTDHLDHSVLKMLKEGGTKLIALRSAGFNHVDIKAADQLGLVVLRVPEYSPYAVAEFAVGLILSLNRKIHKAFLRTTEHNFLLDGLLGFDLNGRTVGVIGTGKIGSIFCKIMLGFGCKLLAFDPAPNEVCQSIGVEYTNLKRLYNESDIISLHCPLNENSHHLINADSIEQMRNNVMLINTGRGGLIDTKAIIDGLKSRKIGYLGLDVYEEEENLFFQDLSSNIIQDDNFLRLLTFPNVIITGHQAFFTDEALKNIAQTTVANIVCFLKGKECATKISSQ